MENREPGPTAEEERYDRLFQSVLCGIVQYQLEADGTVLFRDANREAIRIFGYTPEEFWQKTDWSLPDLIDERDRGRVLAETSGLTYIGASGKYEYRLRRRDGSPCWIIGNAEVIQGPDGSPLVQSVFIDIDARKEAEFRSRQLAQQVDAGNELLRVALEHTDLREFEYYPRTRICEVPPRTCAYYGCASRYTDMPGSFAAACIAEESKKANAAMFHQIHRGARTASAELRMLPGNIWSRITMTTIRWDQHGAPLYTVGIVEDITREKEMAAALDEARTRDPLTGLYAREAGVALVRNVMRGKGEEPVCALMLLDMDGFDRLNKTEGGVFADAILQDVAAILREETGPEDILTRLGGDEFMLFIRNCDKARATILGPRIAARIQALYAGHSRPIEVSASIGMCVTAVVNEYNGLYRCAESALQHVKSHEKGRAACYLDTSNEVGTALTRIYTDQYALTAIDGKGGQAEDILDFALDLLGKSKRLDDALYLLLSRVGTRYGFDRVSIIETRPEYLSFRYTYQWAKNRADLQMGQDFYLSQEEYEAVPGLYDGDGIYDKPFNRRTAMASCLQAAFWNQGVYAGALGFESRTPHHLWTAEERRLLAELTKLIASFLLKARADTVSQAKTDFLSRMSHEIRTPMNAIAGMTTIAREMAGDKDKVLDCLDKIEAANAYLLSLINDILDMSRIESGKVELHEEPLNLGRQLDRLRTMMEPQAAAKGVRLELSCDLPDDRPLLADSLHLSQVLINILGNAVKFTPPGGRIELSVRTKTRTAERTSLRFCVRDTGIGISKEAQGRIFNAFEQAERDTSAQYGGTGLGLSISSRLVQMMGGRLAVESEPGKGSAFSFTLSFTFAEEESDPEPAADVPAADFQGKRILLAEDNALNREIAVTLLELQGFRLDSAGDGKRAVDMFREHPAGYYDAVLMDIRMPVMDGLEATRQIRTLGRPDSRTIPIIALSANAFDEDTKASIASGMDGHLTKPLDVGQLTLLLQRLFARQS